MGWVNAFAEMATEETLKKVLGTLTYARDTADRMRVLVDGGSLSLYPRNDSSNGWNGTSSAPFGPGTFAAVDEREQQRLQSEILMNTVVQRWEFS